MGRYEPHGALPSATLASRVHADAPKQRDEGLQAAATRSIAWIAIDKWATRFFSIATLVVLGRLLSPADFGVVASLKLTLAALGARKTVR